MKRSFALAISFVLIITVLLSGCKKEKTPQSSSSVPQKEYLNASSSIAKTETDGNFTFAFDPYVLPEDVKEAIGGTLYYNRFVNAIINKKDTVSMPSREVYDNIRFALGENFPFSVLIEGYRYDSKNDQVMISYAFEKTHSDKIDEFKKAVGDVFDECVMNSDDDALAAMSVYKWVAENITIVKSATKTENSTSSDIISSSIAQTEEGEQDKVQTDIYTTLINKEGTDESVAALYSFLLMQIGVEGKSVSAWENNTTYTTWNLIKLGSKWYHCDIAREQKSTDGAGLKYFGMTQKRVLEYIKSSEMFVGEWKWFSSEPPKANSGRFSDFSSITSWEIDDSRNKIKAYTEQFNQFIWEI